MSDELPRIYYHPADEDSEQCSISYLSALPGYAHAVDDACANIEPLLRTLGATIPNALRSSGAPQTVAGRVLAWVMSNRQNVGDELRIGFHESSYTPGITIADTVEEFLATRADGDRDAVARLRHWCGKLRALDAELRRLTDYLDDHDRKRLDALREALKELPGEAEGTIRHRELLATLAHTNNGDVQGALAIRGYARHRLGKLERLHDSLSAGYRIETPFGLQGRFASQLVGPGYSVDTMNAKRDTQALSEECDAFLSAAARSRGIIGPGAPLTGTAITELDVTTRPMDDGTPTDYITGLRKTLASIPAMVRDIPEFLNAAARIKAEAEDAGQNGTPKARQKRTRKRAETPPKATQYVTLDNMAAIVNRGKRTLERLVSRTQNPLPSPDIEGGSGKPHEWVWSKVRPWLEAEFGKQLPEVFPTAHPEVFHTPG